MALQIKIPRQLLRAKEDASRRPIGKLVGFDDDDVQKFDYNRKGRTIQ